MTSNDTWITLAQASARQGKSIATIRRWLNLPGAPIRTELRHGTRYVHEADVAEVALDHPAPVDAPARAACAESGHQPDPEQIKTLGDLGEGDWITFNAAGRVIARSKSTIRLWISRGELRSVHCPCRWRRFIWTPDLDHADQHHQKRKGHRHE